jgi:hypothetical protein
MLSEKRIKELIDEVVGNAQSVQAPITTTQAPSNQPTRVQNTQIPQQTQPKETLVKFDTNTDHPFEVTFSERGFLIGNTRLSFEALENALSKEYDIILEKGTGLALTQVRMQKILKYKDLYQ